jgi:hypothetical protein
MATGNACHFWFMWRAPNRRGNWYLTLREFLWPLQQSQVVTMYMIKYIGTNAMYIYKIKYQSEVESGYKASVCKIITPSQIPLRLGHLGHQPVYYSHQRAS